MAYSSGKKESEDLVENLDDIIDGSFFRKLKICGKIIFESPLFIGSEIYKGAKKAFYHLTMRQDPKNSIRGRMREHEERINQYDEEEKRRKERKPSIVEVIGINDTLYPSEDKLERICEKIGKDIDKENKNIKVDFAGLLYHLYASLEEEQKMSLTCSSTPFRIFPDCYEKNFFGTYDIKGKSFYAPIELFASLDIEETNLPVKFNSKVQISPETYKGGFLRLRDNKLKDEFKVCISPANSKVHKLVCSNFEDLDSKEIQLGNDYPTYLVFTMPPSLAWMKDKIVEKYEKHSGIIDIKK